MNPRVDELRSKIISDSLVQGYLRIMNDRGDTLEQQDDFIHSVILGYSMAMKDMEKGDKS